MKIKEPDCVVMKRRGAEYVAKILSQKSREEQLEFWIRRTEKMISRQQKSRNKQNALKSNHISASPKPTRLEMSCSNLISRTHRS